MFRRSSIAIVCIFAVSIWAGCKRSDENRPADEQTTVAPSENRRASADEKKEAAGDEDESKAADEDAYRRLGQMYQAYGEACPADGDGKASPLCQREMAGQMSRQMMHMHEHYGGWGERPPRGHMPMHGHHRGPMHGRGGMHGPPDTRGEMPMRPGWHPSAMDTWHRQMSSWHQQMAEQMEASGSDDLAKRHRELMEHHRSMADAFGEVETEELEEPSEEDGSERKEAGRRLYVEACAACHGPNGEGVSSAFPPLAGSSIVTGDSGRLAKIVTFGLTGPVEVAGEVYDGVMPTFGGRLSDAQIAAILTYVRGAWDNDSGPISPDDIEDAREDASSDAPLSSDALGIAP